MLRTGRERGFSLLEIVVMLAIVLVLASVIAPSLIAFADQQRAEETAGRVSQLTTQPVANNAAQDDDSCGDFIKGSDAGQWTNNAPYAPFTIPRNGLVTPIGIAEDTMSRNPNNNSPGVNQIVFKSVDLRDVLLLDGVLDAGDGAAGGIVQWNTTPLVMFYLVTVDNKC
jgi:type II secretory pathway pseudopilin PulG